MKISKITEDLIFPHFQILRQNRETRGVERLLETLNRKTCAELFVGSSEADTSTAVSRSVLCRSRPWRSFFRGRNSNRMMEISRSKRTAAETESATADVVLLYLLFQSKSCPLTGRQAGRRANEQTNEAAGVSYVDQLVFTRRSRRKTTAARRWRRRDADDDPALALLEPLPRTTLIIFILLENPRLLLLSYIDR